MSYNRQKAVNYANIWWNSRNPAYPSFAVDCTNFVSQCLHAGGWQMTGFPDRAAGWWLRDKKWSFSWSVAHSLRWYLEQSDRAVAVDRAGELQPGDVICYDFQGDRRVDHTAIVTVVKDGVPFVNAHTGDSYQRLWTYTDSTAFTGQMVYYYFHIKD